MKHKYVIISNKNSKYSSTYLHESSDVLSDHASNCKTLNKSHIHVASSLVASYVSFHVFEDLSGDGKISHNIYTGLVYLHVASQVYVHVFSDLSYSCNICHNVDTCWACHHVYREV